MTPYKAGTMFGEWLLCDFHIHTRGSDGALEIEEVVDLFGTHGFDAVAITDHVLDSESLARCRREGIEPGCLPAERFEDHLLRMRAAARRARETYGMVLIPGVEITNDTRAFHLLCIDIREFIDPDLPVETIIETIHRQGGIAVACHPQQRNHIAEQQSRYLWENHERFSTMFDAWEVANRDDLFNVVGLKKFNYLASSDFHEPRHLYSWKTLLQCEKNPESIKSAIRTNKGVGIYLYRSDAQMNRD